MVFKLNIKVAIFLKERSNKGIGIILTARSVNKQNGA